MRNFTLNYPDEKAGIILTSEITVDTLVNIWIMFLFYDGATPPAGVFDMFTSIGALSDTTKTRSYYDLLAFNDWAIVKGSVYAIFTETTTLPNADAADVADAHLLDCFNHWVNVSNSIWDVPGLIASVAFQPYPASFARRAKEIDPSGDLLALDDSAHRIIFEFDFSYWPGLSLDAAARVDDAAVRVYSGMKDIVDTAVADRRIPDAYRPLFMNDAYFRQDYWGRINPDSRALVESVRDSVDPAKFWKKRTAGGFALD